jgi:hypothetical protein
MTYVEGHGVKDAHVLHWVREKDVDLAHLVPPKALCNRPVMVGEPTAPSRPCTNCARRKAAYENRARHRLFAYKV